MIARAMAKCYNACVLRMNRGDRAPYVLIVVFALLVLVGFYFVITDVASLKADVRELTAAIERVTQPPTATTSTTPDEEEGVLPPPSIESTKPEGGIHVPAAIIFNELSSPLLQPQSSLTITVDGVTKEPDGTLTVGVKVFTNQATSYSAIEIGRLFEIVSLEEGGNQKPLFVNGSFNSIPPKSASSGSVVFKVGTSATTIILQVGTVETAKFFEFNFTKKTYKEIALG